MAEHPIKGLVEDLGARLSDRECIDRALCTRKKGLDIRADGFRAIPPVRDPKRIAFVDGGDRTLEESPNFLISINRIYFSIFCGKRRIRPRGKSRVEFFSYVTSSVEDEGGRTGIRYDTRLFPYERTDAALLPDEADLASRSESSAVLQSSRINSLSRSFAEWRMARHVIENELSGGDMLVMDGSLQTSFKKEARYADSLYEAAVSKGVVLCGLSKTSRLVTESGHPLLPRISEIAEGVDHERWYVRVAEETSPDNSGYVMATRLHRASQDIYRFEILREQFKKMEDREVDMVLGSLAENSRDAAMPGYPYGLVDADRFAQVRNTEIGMYRDYVRTEMSRHPDGERMQRYSAANRAHDRLNEVTS